MHEGAAIWILRALSAKFKTGSLSTDGNAATISSCEYRYIWVGKISIGILLQRALSAEFKIQSNLSTGGNAKLREEMRLNS